MTTHTPGHRPDLADIITELTTTHTHREPYTIRTTNGWETRHHTTRVPSLIQQLWDNDTPSAAAEEGPRPGYKSKPAARLDALDTATRIDLDASAWIRDLGEDDHHTDTAACIRQLWSLAVSADDSTRREVETDIRRWWTRARIVTGWDSPAWQPDATCPSCAERGTLRIRLSDQIGMCTNDACRAVWEPDVIGLLADHIRAESAAGRAVRDAQDSCWCPIPAPPVDDLGHLCPRCGSWACTHALGARMVTALRGRIGA